MTALEELQEAVAGKLCNLTKDNLLHLSDFLNISGKQRADVSEKPRMSLFTHIMKHLEREERTELEDGGMSELLSLQDEISKLITDIGNGAEKYEKHIEREKLQKELGLQRELKELKTRVKQKELEVEQLTTIPVFQGASHQPQINTQPNSATSFWRKDVKISGQIGEPGQKDKLSFSSLAHQIEIGLNRGYPEMEIVDAVIRAISPGAQLRSYLEGKPGLTLPTLRRILRSHFQEKSATELYKQLASEAQHIKETPQSFLMRVLGLKQKVLFASQESESGLTYDPALVQRMFLHTILTGLQDDSVKIDMQPLLLDDKSSDELLLERLNFACANEVERKNKKKQNASQPAATVNSVQSEGSRTAKGPVKEAAAKVPPELLSELKELRTGVASLKTLSAEIAEIKEQIQQPVCVPQPWAPSSEKRSNTDHVSPQPLLAPQQYPPAYHSYSHTQVRQPQYGPKQYYSGHNQPRAPAPNQPQYGAPQHPYRSFRAPRQCFACQQGGGDGRCTHCYRCGSGEHFQAGCRIRGTNPSRETPLNTEWLPPRDRC